jgi:hypothetical protein
MRKDIEILLESEQADEERVNTKIFISKISYVKGIDFVFDSLG